MFVCATNLMDQFDPDVLRRFDIKIQLGYLKPDQAEKLFARVLADIRGYIRPGRLAESVKVRLSQLRTLTPRDFATVVRLARVLGELFDSERLLKALEEECRAKQHGMKSVTGFVS